MTPDPLKAKHEHKFTCERWNHNDESPDGRNSRHWLTCEVSGCSEWIWQFPSPDDNLKPETLGFEREAAEVFRCVWRGQFVPDNQWQKAMIAIISRALEAAFSKGIAQERVTNVGSINLAASYLNGLEDGWNACQKEAVIAAELYCIFGDDCNESDYDCRACKAAKEIRALKPAKGERT